MDKHYAKPFEEWGFNYRVFANKLESELTFPPKTSPFKMRKNLLKFDFESVNGYEKELYEKQYAKRG
jgi:hypothetical protein